MTFLMPNKQCELPPFEYVVTIDSIEQLTGLNFFPNWSKELETHEEQSVNYPIWNAETNERDVQPLPQKELSEGIYNTSNARLLIGQKVTVVGKVVSTKFLDKSQSTFLNPDKSFPNQYFTVTIWKDERRNFSYKPEIDLDGKYILVSVTVEIDKNGTPLINVSRESQIKIIKE